MNGDQSLLTKFEERVRTFVSFGYDNRGYTLGNALIDKGHVIIEKVALVDGLKQNFLSISQLCDNGNKVYFSQEDCIIANKQSRDILLTRNKKENIYIADFNSSKLDTLTCLLNKPTVDYSWI